jgi:hypothetical protein
MACHHVRAADLAARRAGESGEEYQARLDKARPEMNKRLLTLVHACFQVGGWVGGWVGGCQQQ